MSDDVDLWGWTDDTWTVRLLPFAAGRAPLRPLGLVGLALAAKALFGRESPPPEPASPADLTF